MIDDIKKSFNEIIYERTTSPFYGTLISSWIIWNWKILYLTFFISEKKITTNKIDFIIANYSQIEHILIYPLISTFLLLTVIPFIANGAFWISLRFTKWKVDQKNYIDKKQLLTVEQSIELREEIAKQEERFAKLVENKNLEITQLNSIINDLKSPISQPTTSDISNTNSDLAELEEFAEKIRNDKNELKQYESVINYIQKGYSPVDKTDVTSKIITILESYDIIRRQPNSSYQITETGKKFYRLVNR